MFMTLRINLHFNGRAKPPTEGMKGAEMATISEVKWYKTGFGQCNECGRERPLGKVNTDDEYADRELCIDCFFGPPMEFWEYCEKCGSLEVNPKASCYGCGTAPY